MRSMFSKFVGNERACVYRVTRVNDTRFESLAFSTAEDMLLMLHVMGNDYHIRKCKVR